MKITKSKETVNDDIRLKMKRWVVRVKKQESVHIYFYGSAKRKVKANTEKVMKNEH